MPSILLQNPIAMAPRGNLADPAFRRAWEEKFFELIQQAGVANIKHILTLTGFKNKSGALEASIAGEIKAGGVTFFADAPHAEAVDRGVKPHPMFHLKDRIVPITFHKMGGSIKVYRRASLKALLAGKFRHPGTVGKHFMRRGIQDTIRQIPALLAEAREAVVMVL